MDLLIWVSIVIPLVGGLVGAGVANRKLSGIAVTLSTFLSALILALHFPLFFSGEVRQITGYEWWYFPGKSVKLGLLLDPLSVFISFLVAFIALFIMIYSTGYMREDSGARRFWFFMGAFVTSMLLLVLADNLLLMLVGWEGVGLTSYFLIGHYYRDEKERWIGGPAGRAPLTAPSSCATKAILFTGAGDIFMISAILLLYSYTGTFGYLEMKSSGAISLMPAGVLFLISVLFLLGPIGKSAQFPLMEWLPEAMAGPTPVSALLHSATMVKAGVFLVARMLPVYRGFVDAGFQEATWFFILAAWIGAVTAILAAVYGVISLELKKILAYSTISQLGYMLLILGVAGLSINPALGLAIAMFHLLSHALFKAALFLGSGIVIHASGSIYADEMGGLRKYIPLTFLLFSVAAFSLAGVPPLLGFWSKDAILSFLISSESLPLLLLAFCAAILTAFYTLRMISLVFLKKNGAVKKAGYGEEKIMVIPVAVFVLLTLILGFGGNHIEEVLHTSMEIFFPVGIVAVEGGRTFALFLSMLAIAAGFTLAYLLYIRRLFDKKMLVLAGVRSFFWMRPLDRLYHLIWGYLFVFAGLLAVFESKMDAVLDGASGCMMELALKVRRLQSGDLDFYFSIACIMLLSMIFLFALIWRPWLAA